MKMVYRLLTVPLFSCIWASTASAHGGQTDGHGGHNNRKAGNYHFHKGPLAGRTFDAKAEAIAELNRVQSKESEPAPLTRLEPQASTGLDGPTMHGNTYCSRSQNHSLRPRRLRISPKYRDVDHRTSGRHLLPIHAPLLRQQGRDRYRAYRSGIGGTRERYE